MQRYNKFINYIYLSKKYFKKSGFFFMFNKVIILVNKLFAKNFTKRLIVNSLQKLH
jgi:hypothetical protein